MPGAQRGGHFTGSGRKPGAQRQAAGEPESGGAKHHGAGSRLLGEPAIFRTRARSEATGGRKDRWGQRPASRPRRGTGILAFSADRLRVPSSPIGLLGGGQRPNRRVGEKGWMPVRRKTAPQAVRRTREALRARAAVRCSRGEATAKRQRRQGSFRRKLTQPARVADP